MIDVFYTLHLLFSLALFMGATGYLWYTARLSIFHPATYYLFFHGLVFAIRPMFQLFFDFHLVYDLYKFQPAMPTKHLALAVANLGLVSFLGALLLTGRGKVVFSGPTKGNPAPRGLTALVAAFLFCAPAMFASLANAYYATDAYNWQTEFMFDSETGISVTQGGAVGYLVDANTMLGPFAIMIAWCCRFSPLSMIPLLLFFGARLSVGWARYSFMMTGASALLLYCYDRRLLWPRRSLIMASVAMLCVFSLTGLDRGAYVRSFLTGEASVGDTATDEGTDQSAIEKYVNGMDFANLEYLEYLVETVPDKTGTYDYFLDALQIFTEPIPRAIWPGKPVGAPIKVFNVFDYGFPIGATWSVPGIGWQSLGFPGVAIWCAFGGWLYGRLYNWFMRSDQSRYKVMIYCLLLPLSVQWFRDGALVSLIKFPLFWLLPVGCWYLAAKAIRSSSARYPARIRRYAPVGLTENPEGTKT